MATERQDMADDVFSANEGAQEALPQNNASHEIYDAQGINMNDNGGMEDVGDEQDVDKAEYGEEMGDDDVGFSNSAADLN
mmetsp:Transcript_20856/g.25584  ORF Transcript_20856/g.25584 Transcript_20856/m.25584 type:complete len:80 (-) Transcript_20856:2039-2278(-)